MSSIDSGGAGNPEGGGPGVAMLQWVLAALPTTEQTDEDVNHEEMSRQVLRMTENLAAARESRSINMRLLGVGVFDPQGAEYAAQLRPASTEPNWRNVLPAVFIESTEPGVSLVNPRASRQAYNLFTRVSAVFHSPPDLAVVALPTPKLFAGPSQSAYGGAGGQQGTIGCRVTFRGQRGLLTAGHVAPLLGTTVTDSAKATIGTIGATQSLTASAPGYPSADVAVMTLAQDYDDSGGLSHDQKSGRVAIREDVTAYGAVSGSHDGWIVAIATQFAGPLPSSGDWGHVYITSQAVSQPGDSGAPVFIKNTQAVVAQVVGGDMPHRGYSGYTLVQDLEYQLKALDAVLR
jgi:hypothetical protein